MSNNKKKNTKKKIIHCVHVEGASSLDTFSRCANQHPKINTTSDISEAGISHPSVAPEDIPDF
jgi:type I site-specific restriction endonuclease